MYGSSKATVFEVDSAGISFKCTNVYVNRSTKDGVEVEFAGETGSTRLPRKGWTVLAAIVGHHADETRTVARH